jgi:hypothetical protein
MIEWPERQKPRVSRDLLLRSSHYVRDKYGTVRQRVSGPKVRRASDDFGPPKPEGYVFSDNYVAQSYNSTAWYIACGVLLIIGLGIVASRSGGIAGLGVMFLLFILANLYRLYRKVIKPKIDRALRFWR